MSDANILLQMTMEKARRVEEIITRFLGHKPSWRERKSFRIMNSLSESSVYHKGELLATIKFEAIEDPAI